MLGLEGEAWKSTLLWGRSLLNSTLVLRTFGDQKKTRSEPAKS